MTIDDSETNDTPTGDAADEVLDQPIDQPADEPVEQPVEETTSIAIVGLTEDQKPYVVKDDLTVGEAEAAPDQDVMEEMRASVAAAQAADELRHPKAPEPAKEEEPPATDDAPADEEKKTGEEGDGKATEDDKTKEGEAATDKKPEGEEKKEGEEEKPKEGEEGPDLAKLAETVGGAEKLATAVPLFEALAKPDSPVSERVAAVEAFIPAEQMPEIRNEIFWQGVESPEVQTILVEDPDLQAVMAPMIVGHEGARAAIIQALTANPAAIQAVVANPEARELIAQTLFGVPAAFARDIVKEQLPFYQPDEIAGYKWDEEAPAEEEKKGDEAAAGQQEKTDDAGKEKLGEKKTGEEKPAPPPAPATDGSALGNILADLSRDVDLIFVGGELEVATNDDATTAGLKTSAAKEFEESWASEFLKDSQAKAALDAVRAIAETGDEAKAREKYAALSQNAKRVAAALLERVSAPLAAHRETVKAKVKTVAPTRTAPVKKVSGKGANVAPVPNLKTDADLDRAMQESIERHGK